MDPSSPIKGIPDCWKDEKRMNSLFAPFRKKEINPVDWESKMKFWHSVIEKWCFEYNKASFSVQIIQKVFKRNGKTAVCIDTAVEELLRIGEIKCKSDFLSIDPHQSWTTWAVDSFVKTPVSWSFTKMKSFWAPEEIGIKSDTEFVHMSFLKEKSNELYSKTESSHENIISYKEIKEIFSDDSSNISDDTVHCIVHYLQLQGKATVETVGDTKLVKILRLRKSESREITQADLAIFKLQQNKAVLEKNIEHLEQEKEKCVEEAKAHLNKGMEQLAKSCLRKKKQLDKCIEKRSIALDNLESLLASLQNTESDTKVLDAYKVGLAALKGTFKSSGLSEDGVFETMAQLQEMNDIQDEIQLAMSQPIVSGAGDGDIEDELAEILSKPSPKLDLPDVPDNSLDSLLEDISKAKKIKPSHLPAS